MSTNRLESYIRGVADTLHAEQVCRLYKIPNDIKITGGQIIHAEQGPADFWGFTASGRVIVLECKITSKPRLPFGPGGLKPHQHRAILEAHQAGGIGLLAWQYDIEIAVIDPDQIAALSVGRKSVPWKAISEHYKKPLVGDPRRFFWPHLSPYCAAP